MKAELAEAVVKRLAARGLTLATAESCTGGGIGAAITAASGSSSVYRGGIISYCNEIKHRLLGVPQAVLDEFGAVSEQTARHMALGARQALGSDLALSVTGLAGPNGDGSGKPVGLVYVGLASKTGAAVEELHLTGSREEIRAAAVEAALRLVLGQTLAAEGAELRL